MFLPYCGCRTALISPQHSLIERKEHGERTKSTLATDGFATGVDTFTAAARGVPKQFGVVFDHIKQASVPSCMKTLQLHQNSVRNT